MVIQQIWTVQKHLEKNFENLELKCKGLKHNLLKTLQKVTEDEGHSLTITEVLGYLLYRVNYQTNRDITNIGSDIFNVSKNKCSYNKDEAIFIMHHFTQSKEQLRTMKHIMESKRLHFPNTNELNEAWKKLWPAVSSLMNGRGVYADYYDLITDYLTSSLTSLNETLQWNCTQKMAVMALGSKPLGKVSAWKKQHQIRFSTT